MPKLDKKGPKPLPPKLKDPELMYGHIRVGLTLVSGSDLNYMDKEMKRIRPRFSPEDKHLLKANWALVRARLIDEGFE